MTPPLFQFLPGNPGIPILGAIGFDEDKEKKLACRAPCMLVNLAGYLLSANDHVALAA